MSPNLWTSTSACRVGTEESHQRKTATPGHMPTVGADGDPGSYRPHLAKDGIGMNSVPDVADVPPPSPCPNCGQQASSAQVRRQSGALAGEFLCPGGHIWTMRWMEVA